MNMYIPIIIVVAANTVYQICAKSAPKDMDMFASLVITYLVGAAASLVIYLATQKNPDLIGEFRKVNWSSFAMGIAVVGLEAGFILAYKLGWSVSTAQIVQAAFLAVVLLFVGYLLYKEPLTVRKIAGIAVCLAGLYLINKG